MEKINMCSRRVVSGVHMCCVCVCVLNGRVVCIVAFFRLKHARVLKVHRHTHSITHIEVLHHNLLIQRAHTFA